MTNFYAIQGSKLQSLGDAESLRVFRSLIYAEAWRIGLPKSAISISEKTSTQDGGLDAKIDNSNNLKSEFIYNGLLGFQIKGYDLNPAGCAQELHQKDDLKLPLKPEVEKLLKAGGTYILVLFHEYTELLITSRKDAIVNELARLGYTNKVEVWEAGKLASYCDLFPSVISEVNPELLKSLPHSVWANQGKMREPEKYYADDARKTTSLEIQKAISEKQSALFFRIDGLPGIGKTRFVCETLREDTLANATVYLHAENFIESPLWFALQKNTSLSGIFVIDECSVSQHSQIVATFSAAGSRLVFLTMSYQAGKTTAPTNKFSLTALPNELIDQILLDNFQGLSQDVRYRLVDFSDGFPRIAILLGKSYLNKPASEQGGKITLDESELLNRLLCGNPILSDADKKIKRALSAIALFEKIGFVDPVDYEAKWLAQEFGIAWNDFKDIISEQKDRGIVQGDHYLYVTPSVLKIHLIEFWWQSRGLSLAEFTAFVNSMPEAHRDDLFGRFAEHFKYLDTTHQGIEFVKNLLNATNGLFSDPQSFKNKLTADFFLILTEVNPEAALKVLEKHMIKWSHDDLLKLKDGRRQILRSLEVIAVWEPLFPRAAELMSRLAMAENETWSNNSTGILKDLFGIGVGPVATTEANPEVRFNFLKSYFSSNDPARIKIGFLCLSEYLETTGGHRTIGPEYQGTKTVANLWRPRTYEELYDAWMNGWSLLKDLMKTYPNEASEIAINRARGLIRAKPLTEIVTQTLEAVPQSDHSISKKLLMAVQTILRFECKHLTSEITDRLKGIQSAPFGNDKLLADLHRYVGVQFYADPDFTGQENYQEQRANKITNLADQFLKNIAELEKKYDWLFSKEAENTWEFGHALGLSDKNNSLLSGMHSYLESNFEKADFNPTLLGGYINGIRQKDANAADAYIEKLSESNARKFIIDIIFRSGINDKVIKILIDTDTKHPLPARWFGALGYGGILKTVTAENFNLFVNHLLSKPEPEAAGTCIQMFEFYYGNTKNELPIELAMKILTDNRLLSPPEGYRIDTMTEYYWNELAKRVFKIAPDQRIFIVRKLLQTFGDSGGVSDSHSSLAISFINQSIAEHAEELWNTVSPHLLDMHSGISYSIREWLRKSLSYFPKQLILDWIKANPKERAHIVADIAPKEFSHNSGSLSRDLIETYGADENVRGALGSSVLHGVWTGPFSNYYQSIADFYIELAKQEPNTEIRLWFDEMANNATQAAKQERIREEKRGY